MTGFNQVEVSRNNIKDALITTVSKPELEPGQVRLKIESFALTTNNVTYAATGDVIGYWKFFPSGNAKTGIVPVWGFACVLESRSEILEPGERLYGFFPMAEQFVMTPEERGAQAVEDVSVHRIGLPEVYNRYQRVEKSPGYRADLDHHRALLYPLFATSYVLFDWLQDNDWFLADQIIIGSASSKTGLGLCKFLAEARPDVPRIIGLTSRKNSDFVDKLNACDQVVCYEDIETLENGPSVYVDMAGNASVRSRLHHHLADNMVHSAAVGTSHWDKFEPGQNLPGAKPRFFFAPSQIAKRRQDWGPGVIDSRIEQAWARLVETSGAWMRIACSSGIPQAKRVYQQLAAGDVDPAVGHVVAL